MFFFDRTNANTSLYSVCFAAEGRGIAISIPINLHSSLDVRFLSVKGQSRPSMSNNVAYWSRKYLCISSPSMNHNVHSFLGKFNMDCVLSFLLVVSWLDYILKAEQYSLSENSETATVDYVPRR